MEDEVNREVLAKVLGVYSVGSATQVAEGLNVVFRQEEEDNSSWTILNVFELAATYKAWCAEELDIELASWMLKEDSDAGIGAYCVSYKPNSTFDDFEDSITASSEVKAIRLMTETMYERSLNVSN